VVLDVLLNGRAGIEALAIEFGKLIAGDDAGDGRGAVGEDFLGDE
jgi:hypothetical protein